MDYKKLALFIILLGIIIASYTGGKLYNNYSQHKMISNEVDIDSTDAELLLDLLREQRRGIIKKLITGAVILFIGIAVVIFLERKKNYEEIK